MGRKKPFIDKEAAISFQLVAASHDDPRIASSNIIAADDAYDDGEASFRTDDKHFSALRRFIPPNQLKKGAITKIPTELLKALEPTVFGIHANLPSSQLQQLCKEIYGTEDVAAVIRARLDYATNTADPDSERTSPLSEDRLEKEFTYFPLDGYDYEQHLRSTNRNAVIAATDLPSDHLNAYGHIVEDKPDFSKLTEEEIEALRALESDNEEDDQSVGLEDRFVELGGGVLEENAVSTRVKEVDLLWGGHVLSPAELAMAAALERRRCMDHLNEPSLEREDSVSCASGTSIGGDAEGVDLISASDTTELRLKPDEERDLQELLDGEYATDEDDGSGDEGGPTELVENPAGDEPEKYKNHVHQFIKSCEKKLLRADDLDDRPLDANERASIMALAKEWWSRAETETDDDLPVPLEPRHENWDCETVLSTCSNIYNHPTRITRTSTQKQKIRANLAAIIRKIQVARRLKDIRTVVEELCEGDTSERPHLNALGASALSTIKEDIEDSQDIEDAEHFGAALVSIPMRTKNESAEEKKQRKKAVKAYQRTRREEKKKNKLEAKQLTKTHRNQDT